MSFPVAIVTLNISKLVSLAFASISVLQTFTLTPLPFSVTRTSDCEEESCDFFLISSFITQLLTKSIVIEPYGAELDKEVQMFPKSPTMYQEVTTLTPFSSNLIFILAN